MAAPQRRSQGERREATRAALLDAAIDCLIEGGYSRLTVKQVAFRAGVSEGAHWHHFASKEELIGAALRRLLERIAAEVLEVEHADRAPDEATQLEGLLDRLWRLHRGELFAAATEVLVASRTDPKLGGLWLELSPDVIDRVRSGAAELLPETAGAAGFGAVMAHALGVMRGLAMLSWVPGGDPDAAWRLVKPQLLATMGRS